ncbi:hypothetical protein [Phytoactinopolyspora mesophila]|uniref:Secreted protein n=1 Tax=Phytoactinopolyspora mesophila TaxID=2650750 RepID=A0A7K3MAZ6_9ACTN|nr:hypothetical protein [Phytoactinopolyspora mesophila]NDL60464.1 hypothetical protein [Phytoactinopolyspora mesophila]
MLTKTLRSAMIAGVALAATFGFAGAASATADSAATSTPAVAEAAPQVADLDGLLDLPDTNIGNDLCLLPWFWPGPFNVLTEGQTGYYSACNGSGSADAEGVNILNNVCVAPWLWQGPINFLTSGQDAHYEACNNVDEVDIFANGLMQYMTIQYMIDSDMLDESAFEGFLQGDLSSHDVIMDDSVLGEFGADLPDGEELTGDGGIGNNACILPWLWQGPLNFLTVGQHAHYEACND